MTARRAPVRRRPPAGAAKAVGRFVVLTGLSGAGKSQAIRALEDLGYFCVDNLPTTLIPTLAELSRRAGSEIPKVAIVVDVREGAFLSSFPRSMRALRGRRGIDAALIFLEASDAALVRRFSETRRPHPLAKDRPVIDGIREERERLAPIRAIADRDRRHHRPHRPRAARSLHDAVQGAPAPRAAADHVPFFRFQARRARGVGPGLRRPVPPEPALRAGAARAHRAGTAGRPVHGVARGDEGVRAETRGLSPLRRAALRDGGQELPDRRHRVHGRPPPLGDDRGGLRRALADVEGVRLRVRHRDIDIGSD